MDGPTFGNSPQPKKNLPRGHRIADIHWPQGVRPEEYDDCPISCTCGWEGKVGRWAEHRAGLA